MADDDVSALFAKKREKKSKKHAVSLEAMGAALDRRSRLHEATNTNTTTTVEEEKRTNNDEMLKKGSSQDDEWIVSFDDDYNKRLDGLRIRDMGAESSEEEPEEPVEEQKTETEPVHRGWGQPKATDEDDDAPSESQLAAARHNASGGRYIPKAMRRQHYNAIDINNEEMFPTIGAAVEIEKHNKDDKKNAWTKADSGYTAAPTRYVSPCLRGAGDPSLNVPPARAAAGRDDAIAAVRAISASTAFQPARARNEPEPASAASLPAPKKYVPPHLRNQN